MPKGRDENGPYRSIAVGRDHGTCTGKGGSVEPYGRYHESACAGTIHQSAAACSFYEPGLVLLRKFQAAEIPSPLCRCIGLDLSGRNYGDIAQMPDVSGGIHSVLDWSWDFIFSCDTSAHVASRSECRIGFIYGSEEHQPPDSQIWPVKNNRERHYVKR